MNFTCETAIETANLVISAKFQRNLSDVETLILEGAWQRLDYDKIAARSQYATSYLSQDAAPKLWKLLTDALGEKVKKSNFKEALRRYWSQHILTEESENKVEKDPSMIPSNIAPPLQSLTHPTQYNQIYIERPPIESVCYTALLQPGSLLRIKAPRFMGKTLLLNRILEQLSQADCLKVYISLQLADQAVHFHDLDRFLRWFCLSLTRDLQLSDQMHEYWDEAGMGSKVSCTTYISHYILQQIQAPLILAIDDIDLLFAYPEVCQDFLGLLRFWYEQARIQPLWQKLRLAIAYATDVYVQLDIYQSPFNVGLPIELSELTLAQTVALAQQSGFILDTPSFRDQDLAALRALVGGHPYLLHHAFSCMSSYPGMTWSKLCREAPTDPGIYGHHLREYWIYLQQHPELVTSLQKVIHASAPVNLEPIPGYQLYRLGLIKLSGNLAESRCTLYTLYFKERLGNPE